MKVGILISAAIIVLIAVVTVIGLRGVPDRSTGYSAPKMLEVKDFSKLPTIVEYPSGDASAAYDAMFAFYEDNRAALDSIDDVQADLAERAMDLVIKSHESGTLSTSYIDKQIPMVPNARPKFGAALQVLADVTMRRAQELHERPNAEQKARAEKAAKAVFAMGLSLFDKSQRVPIRTNGIAIMTSAGTELYNWSGEGNEYADTVTKWTNAINALIEDYWKEKSEVVYSLRLNTPELRATIGDLLKFAYEDKDQSWRIEAILALGRVKYMPGRGKGNDRAVLTCIAALKQDKNAKIAEAAAAAETYTKEDVKNMQ
jgi:hypothetical protein